MSPSESHRPNPRETAAIILAAGRSTRMKTERPKVLHGICDRPMLAYVVDACRAAGAKRLLLVVGYGKDQVVEAFNDLPGVEFVEQQEQKGSGHAVMVCADALRGHAGDVLVIAGDMPLVRGEVLRCLLGAHRASGCAASIATTTLDVPDGYGRIVRDADGRFERIVEHRDCTPEQLKIREVNPSYYCFDAESLLAALPRIKPDNAKGEYYITDALAIIRESGRPVLASTSVPAEDATGINSRADLADVARLLQRRIQRGWMDQGVTIVDPDNTWIGSRVQIGPDAVIKPFTYIEGCARIGRGAEIGPFACVEDGAVVPDGGRVGPSVLTALDSAARFRAPGRGGMPRKSAEVQRQPPASTSCA